MGSPFRSPAEFREVIDRALTVLATDAEIGPRVRVSAAPTRLQFDDLSLVLNIRAAEPGEEGAVAWKWSDDVDWAPGTRMTTTSDVANRCLQGAETVAAAIARRRIRATGDVQAALAMLPAVQPLFERYRALIAEEYPHLAV